MIGFRPIGGYLSGLTNLNSAQIEAYLSLTVVAATLFSFQGMHMETSPLQRIDY